MTPKFFIAILVAVSVTAADEPEPKPLTVAQCERLIEQLANPNKPPFADDYVRRLPSDVSETTLLRTQKPIATAYNELSANIEITLPFLIAHVSDKRFSYVCEQPISGVYECNSIGDACVRIIDTHVSVYRPPVTTQSDEGRLRSLWFNYEEYGGFEKWLKDRRGRTLAELQREQIEWALVQPQPEHLSTLEWGIAKQSLAAMVNQIRTTHKPITVKHRVQFFSK